MSHTYPKVIKEDGKYGPTTQNHYYQPAGYHNRSASNNEHKSKWKLKEGEQYEVFRVADENAWIDSINDGLYSILDDGKEVFGSCGERLAFFPTPANANDTWHGYPKDDKGISRDLVNTWMETNVISKITQVRLLRVAQ